MDFNLTLGREIFVKEGDKFESIPLNDYEDETNLEIMIINNPSIIPLDEISTESEFIPLARQLETGHGPLDIIGCDQFGNLYIIETKLHKNPDKKTVRSQVVDYAAGLYNMDFNKFKEKIRLANSKSAKGTALDGKSIEEIISENDVEEKFNSNLENNLKNGNFTYLIVLNDIYDELKDTVSFHNLMDRNKMYAVTLAYHKPQNSSKEIIISDIYGDETAKQSTPNSTRSWTEDEFYEYVDLQEELNENKKQTIRKFISSIKKLMNDYGRIEYRREVPTFIPLFYAFSKSKHFFHIKNNGAMKFRFRLKNDNEIAFVDNFTKQLSDISGLDVVREAFSEGKRSIPLDINQWAPVADEIVNVIKKTCLVKKL